MQTYYPGEPYPDPPRTHEVAPRTPLDAPKGLGTCIENEAGTCRYYPEDGGGRYLRMRAKGGHKEHWVDRETRTSLCGHKPRNTGRMNRAGWTSVESAPITIQCDECEKKFDKLMKSV